MTARGARRHFGPPLFHPFALKHLHRAQPRARTNTQALIGQTGIVLEAIDPVRETVFDFPPQNVITKDNISVSINALIYYQVVDPVRVVYEIASLPDAIEKLAQTTLRYEATGILSSLGSIKELLQGGRPTV